MPPKPSLSQSVAKIFFFGFLTALTLHPWILFGLRGPDSDAIFWLKTNAALYGLTSLRWDELLYTQGPTLFLSPLLFVFQNHWFFWISSLILAIAAVLGTLFFGWMFSKVCRFRSAALVGICLIAAHPFLHQLHYYWMKEAGYITFLFASLYFLNDYFEKKSFKTLFISAICFYFCFLMRTQGTLALYVGVLMTFLFTGLSVWRSHENPAAIGRGVLPLALLILLPLFLTLPFRYLNHQRYDTWALNEAKGTNLGWYLQTENRFAPENGPHSRQLWEWCQKIRLTGFRYPEIGVTGRNPYFIANQILDTRSMNYEAPKFIYYVFDPDWKRAGNFVVAVTVETIRKDIRHYVFWAYVQCHWYFTGLSENPSEFQALFTPDVFGPRGENYYQIETNRGLVKGNAIGGIAFRYPVLSDIYHRLRTLYWSGMTYLKRITIVTLPLLLIITWRYRRPIRWFLLMAVLVHVGTGMALGMLVGFHHRYASSLEVFTILYTALWIDAAISLAVTQRERRLQRQFSALTP